MLQPGILAKKADTRGSAREAESLTLLPKGGLPVGFLKSSEKPEQHFSHLRFTTFAHQALSLSIHSKM